MECFKFQSEPSGFPQAVKTPIPNQLSIHTSCPDQRGRPVLHIEVLV